MYVCIVHKSNSPRLFFYLPYWPFQRPQPNLQKKKKKKEITRTLKADSKGLTNGDQADV